MTDLEGHVAAGADDPRAEPAQPQPPVPEEPAAEQFQARIEELTQERDQARRELDLHQFLLGPAAPHEQARQLLLPANPRLGLGRLTFVAAAHRRARGGPRSTGADSLVCGVRALERLGQLAGLTKSGVARPSRLRPEFCAPAAQPAACHGVRVASPRCPDEIGVFQPGL
jgi:hypothetical protein